MVVLAGVGRTSDRAATRHVHWLEQIGIETVYLGREERAGRIACVAAKSEADAVELCIAGTGGVLLLRDLLRELAAIGRRDVSIVVHRVE